MALVFVETWWAISDFGIGEYREDDDDVKRGLRTVDLVDEDIDGVERSAALKEVVVVVAAIAERRKLVWETVSNWT